MYFSQIIPLPQDSHFFQGYFTFNFLVQQFFSVNLTIFCLLYHKPRANCFIRILFQSHETLCCLVCPGRGDFSGKLGPWTSAANCLQKCNEGKWDNQEEKSHQSGVRFKESGDELQYCLLTNKEGTRDPLGACRTQLNSNLPEKPTYSGWRVW